MAALPGGLYTAVEVGRQTTPGAFDGNGELRACGLVKVESQVPGLVYRRGSRIFVVVYLYERDGTDGIEAARKRIYDLLHDQQVAPGDGTTCWRVRHVNDVVDAEEPVLDARMALSRYGAMVLR